MKVLEVGKIPVTTIKNKELELFDDLDVLGMYVYLQMLIEHETTTVPEIIDRIIGKFKVDHDFVLFVLKQFENAGLLFVAKKQS